MTIKEKRRADWTQKIEEQSHRRIGMTFKEKCQADWAQITRT